MIPRLRPIPLNRRSCVYLDVTHPKMMVEVGNEIRYVPVRVFENDPVHYPIGDDYGADATAAMDRAERENRELGISPVDVKAIVASSFAAAREIRQQRDQL